MSFTEAAEEVVVVYASKQLSQEGSTGLVRATVLKVRQLLEHLTAAVLEVPFDVHERTNECFTLDVIFIHLPYQEA